MVAQLPLTMMSSVCLSLFVRTIPSSHGSSGGSASTDNDVLYLSIFIYIPFSHGSSDGSASTDNDMLCLSIFIC